MSGTPDDVWVPEKWLKYSIFFTHSLEEHMSLLDRLQPIFRDVFEDPALRVTAESSALTVPGWDSLAHVNLIASVEEVFGVRFALGELQDLKCVGDLAALIESKLSA